VAMMSYFYKTHVPDYVVWLVQPGFLKKKNDPRSVFLFRRPPWVWQYIPAHT
jgi:hypothetical protein